MSSIPAHDRGLTDPLDGLVPASMRGVLDAVDGRAGMRVDDDGIEVRGLLRTRTITWDEVAAIHLESRLDVLLAAGTRFLPVRRIPFVGGLLTRAAREAAGFATRRLTPDVRERSGWAAATIERDGLLARDVDVDGGAFFTALFSPELVDTLVAQATMRHIPVHRD